MNPKDFKWRTDTDYIDGETYLVDVMEVGQVGDEENYRVDLWEYRLGYATPGKTFATFDEAYRYGRKKLKEVQQVQIVDLQSRRPYNE